MAADLSNPFRLTGAQARPAAEVFARAFHDEPLYCHIVPDVDVRKDVLPHLFEFRIRYGVLYGEVHATSSNLEGVAVWIPSDKADMTPWRILRAGGMSLYLKIGSEIVSRLKRVEDYVSLLRRRHTGFQHWYLSPIAVDPSFQGRGYARTLMKAMLTRLDKESLPCYLETQSQKNVAIYERYGFKVMETGTIPDTQISHWSMLRERSKCSR